MTDKILNNEKAWEHLFDKYNILQQVETDGCFIISADQIKEFREPRLMTKFDHSVNLPNIFSRNHLTILPITRGSYTISYYDAYHKFETNNVPVTKLSLPSHIQSLNSSNISSEAIALNCAVASGVISDFIDDDSIFATVSGRMGSGDFSFHIYDIKNKLFRLVCVKKSQIEIDAAYEGVSCLALLEAKMDISQDFLIRQLYYPFRVWKDRVTKPVKPIFMVYSNGIYRLYEYAFENPNNYNSLQLIKQKNYSIEDTTISSSDIEFILNNISTVDEPEIPFPQADNFERVINLCEMINACEMNRAEVTENYDFDARQTNYYTDAARYLGLLEKYDKDSTVFYRISKTGRQILHLGYKQRQLEFCRRILSHKAFSQSLRRYFSTGVMPLKSDIIEIMKKAGLYNIESENTFDRRSSTVKGWINWIVLLINE